MAVLVISDKNKIKAQTIITYAEANVVSFKYLQKISRGEADPVGDKPENSIELFNGYRAVFSVDEQKGGLVRHLSISHRDQSLPHVQAVRMIMELFDFKFALEKCIVWEEQVGSARNAINICEPHNADNWDNFKKKEKGTK